MSRTNIWWPIYPADWAIDTKPLTLEERGALIELLNVYCRQQAPLRDDDEYLARIVGVPVQRWQTMKKAIAPLFDLKDGLLNHAQLDTEILKAQVNRSKKQRASKARWDKKSDADGYADGYADAYAPAMQMQCPSPSPSPDALCVGLDDAVVKADLPEICSGGSL